MRVHLFFRGPEIPAEHGGQGRGRAVLTKPMGRNAGAPFTLIQAEASEEEATGSSQTAPRKACTWLFFKKGKGGEQAAHPGSAVL